jgi:signal transduction histidine kinase
LIQRLPIRVRLALAFAGVMAIVLGATGAFVYARTASDLDEQIERELAARLAGVIAIVRDDGDDLGDPVLDPLSRVDAEGAVQVLGPSFTVADATSDALLNTPLLTEEQVNQLVRGEAAHFDVDDPAGEDRLRVTGDRTRDDSVHYYPLVAAELDTRTETLQGLATLLLIGGPLALLLSSLAAYGVATAALRPVEAMRRRAAQISDEQSGQRLPLSGAGDELDRLGATLNEMLDRLEGALARERRFVGDASHELRTPLAILKAEIALALEQGRSPEELRSALRSAGEETDRLTRLAEDLLVLARAADGALPVRTERLELSTLAKRVAERFREREAAIEVELDPALVVSADPVRLEQALSNLVDNACRYGDGPISITAEPAAEAVRIHVRDRGAGFPPALLDIAFERFARGGGGDGSGAGLGLSIVETIAAAHGGHVGVANRPDGGADAWIELPAAHRPAAAAPLGS